MRKLLVFVFALVSLYANSQVICGGGNTTLQATNPQGLTGPSYSMQPGPFTSTAGAFVVSPGITTTYTLYTTGTNTNNVVTTTSVVTTVTVNPQPASVPSITQAVCSTSYNAVNLGLTFNPGTPAPSFTVLWQPVPLSVLAPNQFSATNLQAGPFTVAVVAAGGCSTVVFFTITPQPAPALFTVTPFGGTHSITCVTPTVELTANNANLSYTWTGSSFNPVQSQSITLDNTKLGTVQVVGQSTTGCFATYSFMITQNTVTPSGVISQTNINITCSQTMAPTLSLTATPSVNTVHYLYSPGTCPSTFVAASYTAIYNVACPGTYTYELVNIANGCRDTKTFVVNSSDYFPSFELESPQNYSLGCVPKNFCVVNIKNGQSTIPPGGGAVTYTMIGPGTSTVYAPTGTLSGQNVYTLTAPGTWTIIVRDKTNQCTTISQQSILQNTFAPALAVNSRTRILSCKDPTVSLEGISILFPDGPETPNVEYKWSFVGTPGNITNSVIAVNIATSVPTQSLLNTYTLTITDISSACISTSVVPIFQNLYPPKASISSQSSPALTCITPTVILSNQSTTGILLSTPFETVQPVVAMEWTGPSPQQPLQFSSTYTAGVVGIYTLVALDRNNGCTATANFTITDKRDYPTIKVKNDTIDCGENFIVLAPVIGNSAGATLTYSWSGPFVTGSNTLATFQVSNPANYTLLVTNPQNGCRTTSITNVITGSLTAAFSADQTEGYAPLSVVFTNNSASSSGSNSITAAWSFGNGTITYSTNSTGSLIPSPIVSSTISPLVVYSQPGTYKVTMFAKKGVCLDTAYMTIKVEVPSFLEIPNVFTPNNDKVNDIFFLRANNLTDIQMTVFDRWGNVVYTVSSETGNVEWDGKSNAGKDAAEGSYFYTLKAMGKDGTTYNKKGTISLYR